MNAAKDQNNVSTLIAVLNSDGSTVTRIKVDPTTHIMNVSDGATGSDNGPQNAARDGNFVPTIIAVSSSDGVTPIPVYCDSSGKLLIKST